MALGAPSSGKPAGAASASGWNSLATGGTSQKYVPSPVGARPKKATEAVPGVDEAEVQLVFSPPWGAHMMSDAVKLELGLL